MPRVCITVPGKNSQPYRFSLDRKIVRLGRAADNDIIIDCPSVSSHHCEMRRVEGGYILQDLDSTNGIKADGSRMEVLDLENDVDVSIGDADLDFELTDDERTDLKKEPHKSHGKVKLPPISKDNDSDEDRSSDEEDKPRPRKQKKRVAPAPAPP
ncbi:MAG: FHA domain-containing protein, partial [Verrucomicrobia bacterium]|nr:FHA domain-containing protein [Verrucomicrobiota bacterium]